MCRGEDMQYIFILIGTILAVLFIVHASKGEQYENLVEGLDNNEYPLKDLYVVGLSWSRTKLFQPKGKLATSLQMQASLLYEPQYAEYYTNIVWAQAITMAHLFLTGTFLCAGMMYGSAAIIFGGGILLSIIVTVYCFENMKNILTKRTEECEKNLPEVVSTMAVLVNSGMVLSEVWNTIANNGNTVLHQLMRKAVENMRNGYSDADAIFLFGRSTNSAEVKKFTSAMLQSMEKSGADLCNFLTNQSSELWNIKRQRMLQSGEKAAAKLLGPILLIFFGIIIIVITAAFAGSLF